MKRLIHILHGFGCDKPIYTCKKCLFNKANNLMDEISHWSCRVHKGYCEEHQIEIIHDRVQKLKNVIDDIES